MHPIEKVLRALDALVQKEIIVSYDIDTKTSNNMSGSGIIVHVSNETEKTRKVLYNKRTYVSDNFIGNKKKHIQAIILNITSSTKIDEIRKIIENELKKYEISEYAEIQILKVLEKYKETGFIKSYKAASDNDDVTLGYDFEVEIFDEDRTVYFDVTLNYKKGQKKYKIVKGKEIFIVLLNTNMSFEDIHYEFMDCFLRATLFPYITEGEAGKVIFPRHPPGSEKSEKRNGFRNLKNKK